MPGVDFKRELKDLYSPPAADFSVVDLPPMNFLMIDGTGDPNTSEDYAEVISALYSVSYTLKFDVKKADPAADYAVMPLEGLWWSSDNTHFETNERDQWQWTMMIMQPPAVTPGAVEAATIAEARKKPLPALPRMRFESFHEGLCAQILYRGAYKDEGPTIKRLHEFIHDRGYTLAGKHHEVYLGDPRRTEPAKLKTILRHPMSRPSEQPVT
jgi:hypothetical protein